MYIPILKYRLAEVSLLKDYVPNSAISTKIIPLVELAEEKMGDVVSLVEGLPEKESYINDNGRKCWRQKKISTDTVPFKVNKAMGGRKIMIDYLRLSPGEYNGIKTKLYTFCTKLDTDYNFYLSKIKNLLQYRNIIPVISMKPETRLTEIEIENIVDELVDFQKCVRIHVDVLNVSTNILNKLKPNDFLIVDYKKSKAFNSVNFQLLRENCKAQIVVSSVNRLNNSNGEFPNQAYTNLISNGHITCYGDNNLEGYSDYAGLKDNYITSTGGNGTGCALALFFDSARLSYYSFCNYDKSLGMKGYEDLSSEIKNSLFYRSNLDCDSFNEMDRILAGGKFGNWSSWNKVTIISTLFQISKIL